MDESNLHNPYSSFNSTKHGSLVSLARTSDKAGSCEGVTTTGSANMIRSYALSMSPLGELILKTRGYEALRMTFVV